LSAGRSLLDRVKDRIRETNQAGLILPRHMNSLLRAIDEDYLDFRVPQSVTARLVSHDDQDYALDTFRCSECGRLYEFAEAVRMRLHCDHCRDHPVLTQAPIFCASFRDRPPVPIAFSEVMKRPTFDRNSNYCIYTGANTQVQRRVSSNFLKGLKEADRGRPIDSLCWTCPIPESPCQWRDSANFCTYSRYDRPQQSGQRPWRPDLWGPTGRVRLVPRPVRVRGGFGTFVDRYRPITISEGSTKPIRIAVHGFRPERSEVLRFPEEALPGISEVRFISELEIFQFTIALAVGLPYVSIRNRAVRLLEDIAPDGQRNPYFLSRRLVTEGIVVRLNGEIKDRILSDSAQQRRVAPETLAPTLYHTVSHAFMKPLPILAGLDVQEFAESFSATDNEVALYDNSPGGIGGVRTLIEDSSDGRQLRADYIAQLLNSTDCQLGCVWSCKACLHSNSCGWINRQLKRDMLDGIVNEQLRDRYFTA
jgi:hypothetical protein